MSSGQSNTSVCVVNLVRVSIAPYLVSDRLLCFVGPHVAALHLWPDDVVCLQPVNICTHQKVLETLIKQLKLSRYSHECTILGLPLVTGSGLCYIVAKNSPPPSLPPSFQKRSMLQILIFYYLSDIN